MIKPYFTDIKKAIIEELAQSKTSISIVSSFFTDRSIFHLLCSLARQGIKVMLVIADEPINLIQTELNYGELLGAGGQFFLSNRTAHGSMMHHKFCIIDGIKLITGSYNYTYKANENRENILLVESKEVAEEYQKELNFVISELSTEMQAWNAGYIYTDFHGLDRLTGGFYGGELICLAARQGMGKTSLAICMAYNMSTLFNYEVGYISCDLNQAQVGQRLLSIHHEIALTKVQKGNFEEHEWQQIHVDGGKLEQLPIEISEADTMEDVERVCKKLYYTNTKMIIVEGADKLVGKVDRDNIYGADILQRLKNLARQIRIPILFTYTISSNKSSRYGYYNRRPQVDDLGQINNYVDTVLLLNRDEFDGITEDEDGDSTAGKADLVIAKNRSGDIGHTKLNFNSICLKFSNSSQTTISIPTFENTEEDFLTKIPLRPSRLDTLDDAPPF